MSGRISALADILAEDPENILCQDDEGAVRQALLLLCSRMNAKTVIQHAQRPGWRDRLVDEIVRKLRSQNREDELRTAFLELSQEQYHASNAMGLFDTASAVEKALQCEALRKNHEHKLWSAINADEYWGQRFLRYLARTDFERAWDEIKKARRGICVYHGHPFGSGGIYYASASMQAVKRMVRELFDAMRSENLVSLAKLGGGLIQDEWVTSERSQTNIPKDGRRPNVAHIRQRAPGWEFACEFRIAEEKEGDRHEKHPLFSSTGIMILRIAHYFSDKRNERRRARYEQTLKIYRAKN